MSHFIILLAALLLAPLAGLHAAELSRTKPTIIRAVDSVRPGEAELLVGDWPATAPVELAQLNDKTSETALSWQPSKQNLQYGIKKWRPQGDFAAEQWHGVTLYILSGRGAGQYRNVIEYDGKQVTLDQPFAVPPDTSSVVSIGKFQGRHLFVGNEFRDGRFSVQLYAPCCDCIVAESQIWRTARMCTGASLAPHTFTSKTGTPPPQEGWIAQPGGGDWASWRIDTPLVIAKVWHGSERGN